MEYKQTVQDLDKIINDISIALECCSEEEDFHIGDYEKLEELLCSFSFYRYILEDKVAMEEGYTKVMNRMLILEALHLQTNVLNTCDFLK